MTTFRGRQEEDLADDIQVGFVASEASQELPDAAVGREAHSTQKQKTPQRRSGKHLENPAGKKGISKTLLNFWLDSWLLVNFLALLFTATVVRFVFPLAIGANGWSLWGLNYRSWCDLQFGLLATLTLGILVHVMLHWPWVCGVLASRFMKKVDGKRPVMSDGIRTIYGVGLLILLLNVIGLAIALAALSIQSPPLQ